MNIFRAFAYKNITVNKCPIYLNLSIPEIKVGEIAKMNIHASPKRNSNYGIFKY